LHKRKLIWQIFPSFLAIIVAVVAVTAWHSAGMLKTLYFEHTREMLIARCAMVEISLADMLRSRNLEAIDTQCKILGKASKTRITVILPDGKVAGDSDQSPSVMENHSTRPEVAAALTQGTGTSQRRSGTLGQDMIYVARAVVRDDEVVGIIRTALPMTVLELAVRKMYWNLTAAGLVIAAIAGGISLWISARISGPVAAMRQTAELYASGDFTRHTDIPDSAELAALASAMNSMADQLREKIETITLERNELAAVLAGMVEGVLAVDSQARIVSINKAASECLGVDEHASKGRMVHEVVRYHGLQNFVEKAVSSTSAETEDIVLTDEDGKAFQLKSARLPDGGAVIVMNDITKLRRLENMRRDFVANVSHELRTPVTSIKGFVETLLEHGATDPDESRRFLDIIARHTDRLNAIIDDLLSLSRIEEDSEKGRITLSRENIKKVLNAAIDLSAAKARQKDIVLRLSCDDALEADMNGLLIEQAIVNLIDNAVKYSSPGSAVLVEAVKTSGPLEISVSDEGCGIAPEHLGRIFERFYVVDKARSRKLGGTGLGLAIVKHIAQSHGGKVNVWSEVGKGSKFTIVLPAA